MIRYTLKCDRDHTFDSWFQSADAFDKLAKAGMVACAECGSSSVEKSLMAPAVTTDRPLSAPKDPREVALAKMREEVEKNSEYVGLSFAKEARAMHTGDAPERSIYGEAKPEEAKALIEDGVPVLPLPFKPRKQAN
ncbi:DUF1178 family protein [Loktanella sp. IMCC34160]|uniref:DUF1178 family protein n=1 Tax=Loktanella sp. IMCC34160 TaxID=2510646 RepID=UPI00101BCA56|nr:DUF1178 family protein [Loktanella sp. IMCC34160]RYG90638.1 DUF1178 family protein [Loktanella sp. IMCC34160]